MTSYDDEPLCRLFNRRSAAYLAWGKELEINDYQWGKAAERCVKVEAQMMSTPASSAVGLAIKFYMFVESMRFLKRDSQFVIEAFGSDDYDGASGALHEDRRWLQSLAEDAARFAPELAPLFAEIIASPVTLHG